MKVNPAPLHLAQTIITGLVIALSIAILGTSAHTLDVYNKQHTNNPWWLPMWTEHFETQGTKALLASAVVTFVLSAIFLVLSVLPQVSTLSAAQKQTMTNDFLARTPPEVHTPSTHLSRHNPAQLPPHSHYYRLGTHPQR